MKVPTEPVDIAIAAISNDMGKAASANGDWAELNADSSSKWGAPCNSRGRLGAIETWLRGEAGARPNFAALAAQRLQTNKEPPSWETIRYPPIALTVGGKSLTTAGGIECFTPRHGGGKCTRERDANWEGGLFGTQDCFDAPYHFRAIESGDATALQGRVYKSSGFVQVREAN